MTKNEKFTDQGNALIVQKHQLKGAHTHVGGLQDSLVAMEHQLLSNQEILDGLFVQALAIVDDNEILFEVESDGSILIEKSLYVCEAGVPRSHQLHDLLDHVDASQSADWDAYLAQVEAYAKRQDIDLRKAPFSDLMSVSQRIALEKRIKEEFSIKGANCDKYDYMIAGTIGLIGGLIDVLFVGLPGQGGLSNFTDELTNKTVQMFAKYNGWNGPREGSDPTSSAIGFLERNFTVNYDHRHGGDVDRLFDMSTKNHHIKSLGHSPDLVGLFFSILDQFNSTAHFVDDGKVLVVDTDTFDLRGSNVVSKIFAGFANWLGHLFSDVAGSSGTSGRGAGLPIPFFSLLQFVNVGEFGQHKQTFAKISVQVFEQGYDLRHGLALAIPVIVTELLTRIMWVIKQHFYHRRQWAECIPSANNPELRRMLLIAHGALCLADTADAALRSGGEMIQFMLRSNVIAWARFGTLAIKEVTALYRQGDLDTDSVDRYLESEYTRLLAA